MHLAIVDPPVAVQVVPEAVAGLHDRTRNVRVHRAVAVRMARLTRAVHGTPLGARFRLAVRLALRKVRVEVASVAARRQVRVLLTWVCGCRAGTRGARPVADEHQHAVLVHIEDRTAARLLSVAGTVVLAVWVVRVIAIAIQGVVDLELPLGRVAVSALNGPPSWKPPLVAHIHDRLDISAGRRSGIAQSKRVPHLVAPRFVGSAERSSITEDPDFSEVLALGELGHPAGVHSSSVGVSPASAFRPYLQTQTSVPSGRLCGGSVP